MQVQNIWPLLQYPFKAIISRRFYYNVMFDMKGVGLAYLFMLCIVLALPCTVQMQRYFTNWQQLELSRVVAQIPPSTISASGRLGAVNPADEAQPKLIYNSHQQLVVAYNVNDMPLPAGAPTPLVMLTADGMTFHLQDSVVHLRWSDLYGNEAVSFEPLQIAQLFEKMFHSSFFSIWSVLTLWLFTSLGFVALVGALFTKVLGLILMKMRISFGLSLRLSAFGSTLVAVLLAVQFFFPLVLSTLVLCAIPIIYTMAFLAHVRGVLDHSLKDPKYALSLQNPFYKWFERQSRVRPDNTIIQGPDYHELDPEQQAERESNLSRVINISMEQWLEAYQQWFRERAEQGLSRDIHEVTPPPPPEEPPLDIPDDPERKPRFMDLDSDDPNSTQPDRFYHPEQDATNSPQQQQNEQQQGQQQTQSTAAPQAGSAAQQNQQAAPQGTTPQGTNAPQNNVASHVQRGAKGEDSSFMP